MKVFSGISAVAVKGGALHALWTFPSIVGSAFMLAWAAESAQFFISQGLSLAILAWVQTLPEFAVEAVIAWQAPHTPGGIHLVSANFTGAVRLLVGLGWPMIYATAALFHRRKHNRPLGIIRLEAEHSVEVMGLLAAVLLFSVVGFKGTLSVWDGVALMALYAAYMFLLQRIPPQELEEAAEEEWPIRRIVVLPRGRRNAAIAGLFLGGAVLIYFTAEPFLHSLLALALSLGVSQYVFVQWVAPFLSEFPEKLSAFYWARKVKGAPMALMNMVSSNINQWTMLAAMIPFVYALSAGHVEPIVFDESQRLEIFLTLSQSAFAVCLLVNMALAWHEALVLFALFVVQFFIPSLREEVTFLYLAWTCYEVLRWLMRLERPAAFDEFGRLLKTRVFHGGKPGRGAFKR